METILEQQRRYHEERERLIKLMVDEHATKKTSVCFKKKIVVFSSANSNLINSKLIHVTGT